MTPLSTQGSFGQTMFAHAQLGDERRTRRLVQLTDLLCKHPGGSLPEKLKSPKDLKALYRLCDCDQVTHQALLEALRPAVLAEAAQHDTVLIIHDSTELDYSAHKSLAGQLGQVGRGLKKGYLCHNSLAVLPQGRQVLGVVNQILHCRVQAPKNESAADMRQRQSRESRLWLRGTEGLPADRRFVDVADQGADTFEFLQHEVRSGRRFVVRVHHARKASKGHEPSATSAATTTLVDFGRSLPALCTRTIEVPSQPRHGRRRARPARQAQLQIGAGPLLVYSPHAKSGEHDREPLPLWLVRVWEPAPDADAEPIEWLLLTNEPVLTPADAERIISWYQVRWVIEELHKAKKTGCAVEGLQFKDTSRLQPMILLLTVVATTLLNLRAASNMPDAKTKPATTVVAQDYVQVLSLWRYNEERDLSVHEFFYALARLGGHQNRKNDKRPGWLILWRGWTALQTMVTGFAINQKSCG